MESFLTLENPLWEIFVRGTAVYMALAVVFRFLPKRSIGSLSATDIVALVMVGGLASKAMEVGAGSTLDFLALMAVILFWSYVLNRLESRYPWLQRTTQDSPTMLVRDGRLLHRNIERELITEDELMAALRKQGIDDLRQVRLAVLEIDGQVSVVKDEAASR